MQTKIMQTKKFSLVCLLGLFIFNPAYSESQYQPQSVQYQGIDDEGTTKSDNTDKTLGDYKCFFETNIGEGIYDFTWYVEDTQKHIRTLPGDLLETAQESESVNVYVKKVHECLPDEDVFTTERARRLDETRLR